MFSFLTNNLDFPQVTLMDLKSLFYTSCWLNSKFSTPSVRTVSEYRILCTYNAAVYCMEENILLLCFLRWVLCKVYLDNVYCRFLKFNIIFIMGKPPMSFLEYARVFPFSAIAVRQLSNIFPPFPPPPPPLRPADSGYIT